MSFLGGFYPSMLLVLSFFVSKGYVNFDVDTKMINHIDMRSKMKKEDSNKLLDKN